MDKQRRYEAENIAGRLDKIVSELNDLADEEESAFESRPIGLQYGVSGQDSQEAYEAMKSIADAISLETEKLHEVAKARPEK